VAEALNKFLAMEKLGSPIEAAELGRPVNGLEPVGEKDIVDVYPRDAMEQHARLVRWFEEAERSSQNEREQAERDRDYYDGAQLHGGRARSAEAPWAAAHHDQLHPRKVQLLAGMERKGAHRSGGLPAHACRRGPRRRSDAGAALHRRRPADAGDPLRRVREPARRGLWRRWRSGWRMTARAAPT
jgi:hypothetical protein